MNKIFWDGQKFIVAQSSVKDLEKLQLYSLKNHTNKVKMVRFLDQCGFDLIDYIFYPDNQFKIVKNKDCCLTLKDEGTGFNILFHLCGYILTGKDIEIVEGSIKPFLHPNLWQAVKKVLTDDDCVWLSPMDVRQYSKCAVNPLGDCGNCPHFETNKKQKIRFV